MGQVAIVRWTDGKYYREYAIEPGDVLIRICLRYGHTDWSPIYHELPINQPFRDRFTDPDDIDFINPVNFFIPLAGATTSGKKKKGAPIGDYLIARVEKADGSPLAFTELVLAGPGLPPAGKTEKVMTTVDGDVIVANPAPGNWYLASPEFTLTPKDSVATIVPARDVTYPTASLVISDPVLLIRNEVDTLVARPVYCMRCPMCWQIFAVTEQTPPGDAYACPNDGFTWDTIVADIATNPGSFLSPPVPSQIQPPGGCNAAQPTSVPSPLLCRGIESFLLKSVYGDAHVFWDESRFVAPNGGNYTLFGIDGTGTPRWAAVTGRATWGALPPLLDGTRMWDFQRTNAGCSAPAHNYAIPNNETTPLRDTFKWATIHHTGSGQPRAYSTPLELQEEHQVHGPGQGGPAADIGYHFYIDAAGEIFEGRPLGIKGSHVGGFNGGNVGIVLYGNFEGNSFIYETPTQAQLTSLEAIVHAVAARFNINSVWYHRMRDTQLGKLLAPNPQNPNAPMATECPGQRLIPFANGIRTMYPGPPP